MTPERLEEIRNRYGKNGFISHDQVKELFNACSSQQERIKELESEAVFISMDIMGFLRSKGIQLHGDKSSLQLLIEYAEKNGERIKQLEGYMEQLKDTASVHTNILAGRIALTKAQAIHIAGLPADIEERIKEMRVLLEESKNIVGDNLHWRIKKALEG